MKLIFTNLFICLLLVVLLTLESCTLNVRVTTPVPKPPEILFIQLEQLLINNGQGFLNVVNSITSSSGSPYYISYNNSAVFYTTGNPIVRSNLWDSFALTNFGSSNGIVAISPYYTGNSITELLLITYNSDTSSNQLWICNNLNTAKLSCTQDTSAVPQTLINQSITTILGNGGTSYAVLNNNLLLISLSGDNYQVMPNIGAIPNNTAISAINVDVYGNLYVIFNSSTIGYVLYEFNIKSKTWSLILQNDILANETIAIDSNHNLYMLNNKNLTIECTNNSADFYIQYISINNLGNTNNIGSRRVKLNGCSAPITLNNIGIDANDRIYISLQDGAITRTYYGEYIIER